GRETPSGHPGVDEAAAVPDGVRAGGRGNGGLGQSANRYVGPSPRAASSSRKTSSGRGCGTGTAAGAAAGSTRFVGGVLSQANPRPACSAGSGGGGDRRRQPCSRRDCEDADRKTDARSLSTGQFSRCFHSLPSADGRTLR